MLATTMLTACQTPFLVFPGKTLPGTTTQTDSFAFAADYKILRLEVNPENPYSVILRSTVINGELYIDAAQRRKWGQYLARDLQVRVRIGSNLYDATAVPISDPDLTDRFPEGRLIYRLDPG